MPLIRRFRPVASHRIHTYPKFTRTEHRKNTAKSPLRKVYDGDHPRSCHKYDVEESHYNSATDGGRKLNVLDPRETSKCTHENGEKTDVTASMYPD